MIGNAVASAARRAMLRSSEMLVLINSPLRPAARAVDAKNNAECEGFGFINAGV